MTRKIKSVKKAVADQAKEAVTLTFGDCAENHVGMQMIGKVSEEGFNERDLEAAKEFLAAAGCEQVEVVDLRKQLPEGLRADAPAAHLLIARTGVSTLGVAADELVQEQKLLAPDRHFYDRRRKKVLNKHARFNLCFGDEQQKADFANAKGTIVAWSDVPKLAGLRAKLAQMLGEKAKDLACEGNYYYDIGKTGIGFHGDGERRKVVGVRLGASIPLHFQWFLRSKPIGDRFKLLLNHGDFYVMSEKAVGFDWKRSSILTLRHAAGAKHYLTIKGQNINLDTE